MTNEYEVRTLLAPVKAEIERDYGLAADWEYLVDEDDDGIRLIKVRLNVDQDASPSVDQITAIREKVRSYLRATEVTSEYFPHLQINARQTARA